MLAVPQPECCPGRCKGGARRPQQGASVGSRAQRRLPRHGCQPFKAGATERLQQQCLGLVIRMVGGKHPSPRRQPVRQRPIPMQPRDSLDALAGGRRDIQAQYFANHTSGSSGGLGGGFQRWRGCRQAMVAMNRTQLGRGRPTSRLPVDRRELRQREQQGAGIATARGGHGHHRRHGPTPFFTTTVQTTR